MKTKLLIILALLLAFSANTLAQIQINSNKVVYKRKGKDIPEQKRTFEVNYPEISGVKDPKVRKNLASAVDYWKNFDTNLEENLGDYFWLDRLDFDVTYNKNFILVIELIMEGTGAYPDGSVKTLVINETTGRRIYIRDAFTNIGPLLVKVADAQQKEIADHLAELKRDAPEDEDAAREMLDERKYMMSRLEEFSITDEGVTFIYDYGFPHAVQALEPDGRYFFKWAEMKTHINRDGLLGRFVR